MSVLSLIIPLVEIAVITVILNYLLSFFWNTRSMDLVIGLFLFFLIFAASSFLNLPVLNKIMLLMANVAVIGILIIFQPELRVALSKLSLKGKKSREITEFDEFLEMLSHSVYKFSEKNIGALIVMENEDSLDEYAKKGIQLSAKFSSELLETIFVTATPLHDGAVIIRNNILLAASCILPLAEDTPHLSKSMGTRHRAALGISQLTDALIIVVSEESGKVSVAREGMMTRGIKADRFKAILRSVYTPPGTKNPAHRWSLKAWLKRS
jgi:diadenylate cyclase